MFKAFNPYRLLGEDNMPVDRIELGRSPELSRFHCKRGPAWQWLGWEEFRKSMIPVKLPDGTRANLTVGKFLLGFAEWARDQLNGLRNIFPSPWDPGDPVRSWLLPYLRVPDGETLRALLEEDIKMLQEAVKQD